MASLGRARQCWERHGSAVRGTSWQGRAGLGPVTAVACGLVPQASAAPGQPFLPGLAGHGWDPRGYAGLGRVWLGRAGLGPVTAVGRGLRAPAFRCPRGSQRHGWEWRGVTGQGMARFATAGLGITGCPAATGVRGSGAHARPGRAWSGQAPLGADRRGWAWRGRDQRAIGHHRDSRSRRSRSSGRGAVRLGRQRPGLARRGSTGCGWDRHCMEGDQQTSRCESATPTLWARSGGFWHGVVRRGLAGPGGAPLGEARDQRAAGRHHGSSPWRPRTPLLGVARRGTPRRGAARQSKAPHGPAGLGEAGIYNHREKQ